MIVDSSHTAEQSQVALLGARLIDGTGNEPLEDAAVLVEGAIIREVGPSRAVAVPATYDCIDVSGYTILPGMIDCHVHPSATGMSLEEQLYTRETVGVFRTAEILKRTLHAGFTTIREAGGLNDVGFRDAVEMGLIEGPRLLLAGALAQTGGSFDPYYPRGVPDPLRRPLVCDGVPSVQRGARQLLRTGVDFIKICTTGGVSSPVSDPDYTEWTLDELEAIVYEASARGKAVMAHAENPRGVKNAVRAGVWSVEHGDILDDEAIDMLVDSGTYLVPTLSVVYTEMERPDELGYSAAAKARSERIARPSLESFQRAAAAGVKIALGTDALDDKMHGDNARELELMVRHGLTPMEAIVAATGTAAEVCRVADSVGTVEAGKLADLLVVDGEPLTDIRVLRNQSNLLLVMKGGTAYVDYL